MLTLSYGGSRVSARLRGVQPSSARSIGGNDDLELLGGFTHMDFPGTTGIKPEHPLNLVLAGAASHCGDKRADGSTRPQVKTQTAVRLPTPAAVQLYC